MLRRALSILCCNRCVNSSYALFAHSHRSAEPLMKLGNFPRCLAGSSSLKSLFANSTNVFILCCPSINSNLLMVWSVNGSSISCK